MEQGTNGTGWRDGGLNFIFSPVQGNKLVKIMTQEEKAKAYDEVLGRAKSLVDFCSDNELKTLKFVSTKLQNQTMRR